MTKTEKPKSVEKSKATCVILYGPDENDKPRAARFDHVTNRELLTKAAEALTLAQCEVASPALNDLAAKLPAGRLYSNGRGFVPNVRVNLYAKLIDELNSNSTGIDGSASGVPHSFDEIEVGHLVIAHEGAVEGWWEAIVVEKNRDMLTLRWRDYPQQPQVILHRTAVTFLSPVTP